MVTTYILSLIAIFVIIFVITGVRIVQQAETMVIERLGKYRKTLKSGINIILPLFDKAREIDWKYIKTDVDGKTIIRRERIKRIDLREVVYDFPRQNVITKDNVVIEINAILYFQITDPIKYNIALISIIGRAHV